jgi:ATP-dependent Lon protease
MKKAGTKNPVFMLDEIDKMSTDFRGDPSAALLEVLDPAQNFMFQDHYLDVEYDLSEVFFIATANVLHTIPAPLQDRMEVIRLSGYTDLEKAEIAKKFLIRKQKDATGLGDNQLEFTPEGLSSLILSYTREAGVRNLEREIGNVCRKVARKVVESSTEKSAEEIAKGGEVIEAPVAVKTKKKTKKAAAEQAAPEQQEKIESKLPPVSVTPQTLLELLGPPKFRDTTSDKKNEIGATVGLAWTEVGGSILTTEAAIMEGRGKLTTTGKLGDVMQESAQAAMSYIRSRSHSLGLARDFYRHLDIHLHVPEGAIPKDGPSAGITIATSITSALTGIPVRGDIAMTGEITVRGKVLPIGGLKEKMLAAHRNGIYELVLCKENERDLHDIPEIVKKDMKLHFVESMDEVLTLALEREVTPLPISAAAAVPAEPRASEDITH